MKSDAKTLINKFLDKKNIFAVIGVSRNPKKYGSKVYLDLKKSGYRVYPINPNVNIIHGDKCYPKLKDLPTKPDVVDAVVPPKITDEIVMECKRLGINMVWMQPGSESEKAINFCKSNEIKCLYNMCVMVERDNLKNG